MMACMLEVVHVVGGWLVGSRGNSIHTCTIPVCKHHTISILFIAAYVLPVIPSVNMNGHINETAPPLVPIGEVKLVQVQIVVWFVRTCEVWIPFVLHFCIRKCMAEIPIREVVWIYNGPSLTWIIICVWN
jgi:hypothetical protein